MSVIVTARSPAWARSHARSRCSVAPGERPAGKAVSDRRVTVRSLSMPPLAFSIWGVCRRRGQRARRPRSRKAGLRNAQASRPLDPDLAERGHVEEAHPRPHRHMLGALVVETSSGGCPPPTQKTSRSGISRGGGRLIRRGEPVRALPPRDLAKDGARGLQVLMHRRAAATPRARRGGGRPGRGGAPGASRPAGRASDRRRAGPAFPSRGRAGSGGCAGTAAPPADVDPPTGRKGALRGPLLAIQWASAMPAPPEETMPMEL